MIGIGLAALSNLFQEISHSIGKKEVREGAASLYTFGFLTMLFGTCFFLFSGLIRHQLIFSYASLYTFVPRVILEIVQAHLTVRAITIADRGDFGFVKTLTIPLLLFIDVSLGYSIGIWQIGGMVLILTAVVILLLAERGRLRGGWYLFGAAVNAAATISLYKYDISNFNSVEAEQTLVGIALLLYFFTLAYMSAGENPLRFLRKRIFLAQSAAAGLAEVTSSFAYLYAPASVITAALRSFAVLFSVISGKVYFRERHFYVRAGLLVCVSGGLWLLTRSIG